MVEQAKRVRRRRLTISLGLGLTAAIAGFYLALNIDEETKRHLRKQVREAREMPRRLHT
jgi:hypothetical protein